MNGDEREISQLAAMGDEAKREIVVFDERVKRLFPHVPWQRPLLATVAGRGEGFVCRLCVARLGFKADSGEMFKGVEAWAEHVGLIH